MASKTIKVNVRQSWSDKQTQLCKIAALLGSLRKDSINKKVLDAAVKLLPANASIEVNCLVVPTPSKQSSYHRLWTGPRFPISTRTTRRTTTILLPRPPR